MAEESLPVPVEAPQTPSIIRAASSEDVTLAITEYQRIQKALDDAMPDCIMQIGDKSFRKKNYWRAVATAFNLQVEEVEGSEKIIWDDGAIEHAAVTYRASAANGRTATGDGACSASEKVDRQRTLHNIRSHAHTRAYNRAVSNLVGFGEVSAEEVNERGEVGSGRPSPSGRSPRRAPSSGGRPRLATDKQKKLVWRRCKEAEERTGVGAQTILDDVCAAVFDRAPDTMTMDDVDPVLEALEQWPEGA